MGNAISAQEKFFVALNEEGLVCSCSADENIAADGSMQVWSNGESDCVEKNGVGFRVFCKKSDTISQLVRAVAKRHDLSCRRLDEATIAEHRKLYVNAIGRSVARIDGFVLFLQKG